MLRWRWSVCSPQSSVLPYSVPMPCLTLASGTAGVFSISGWGLVSAVHPVAWVSRDDSSSWRGMSFLDLSSWPSSVSVKEGLAREESLSVVHSKSFGKGWFGWNQGLKGLSGLGFP